MSSSEIEMSLLSRLVAIPTVSGQFLPNNQALDLIDSFLRERGMHIIRKDYDGYGTLVATTRPTKTPTAMLVAHLDVVPGAESMFRVRDSNGKLHGRGVLDMKSAIASYMAVVDHLQDQLGRYDFGIMITTDEETYDVGVRKLLADGFRPKSAILLDGGYDWQIEAGAKGAWCFHIKVSGRSAHGSRPWLGDSASFKLHELLAEIRTLFPHADHDTNTLNISAMQAGTIGKAVNQIPDTAEATIDIRTVTPAEHERLSVAVQSLCDKYEAEVSVLVSFAPIAHDLDNPFLAAFIESVATHTGIHSTGVLGLASSDAARFMEYNIPCAVTYPLGGNHHGEEEWIDKEAFLQLKPILLDFLEQTAQAVHADDRQAAAIA